MRDPGEIHLEKVIVHVIDHHHHPRPITSDVPLALSGRPSLRKYFEGQVASALADPQAVAARFVGADANPVAETCRKLLGGSGQLPAQSKRLAEALFAAVAGNRSIAVGNLVVGSYVASAYPGDRFLAMIKIDLTEVLIRQVQTDPVGRTTVTFRVQENALPTLGTRLQKAAIVHLRGGSGEEMELLLLDRQVAKAAADFFARDFLGAEPRYTTERRTELLSEALFAAHHKLTTPAAGQPAVLDPATGDQVLGQIRNVLGSVQVDSAGFVAGLDVSEEAREILAKEIARRKIAGQYAIDPRHAKEHLIKKRRAVAAYGIELEFEADFEGVVVQELEQWPLADGTMMTRICLEAPDWKWVK